MFKVDHYPYLSALLHSLPSLTLHSTPIRPASQLLPSLKGKKYERARGEAEAAVAELAELERMINAAGVAEKIQFETGFAPPLDSRAPGVYFEVCCDAFCSSDMCAFVNSFAFL